MKSFGRVAAVLLLLAAAVGPVRGTEMQQQIPAVEQALQVAADRANAAQLPDLAQQIATEQGRQAVPQLLTALVEAKQPPTVYAFAALTLVRIADPADQFGLLTTAQRDNLFLSAQALGVASLAALGDETARAQLLDLARGSLGSGPQARVASLYASGFLRSLSDPQVSTQVAQILSEETRVDRRIQQNLRALAASLDYRSEARELPAADYLQFEEKFWWGLALAPKGSTSVRLEYRQAAERVREMLGTANPSFLARILREPASPAEEVQVALSLIVLQNETSLENEVTALAESDSPYARAARWALERLQPK